MPCIYHVKHYVDVFFSVVMVNSSKGYSSSFSFARPVCVVSAVSLQIMVDHGRKQQENERFSVGVWAPHRLNRGLELNVCGVQSIELWPPLPLHRIQAFLTMPLIHDKEKYSKLVQHNVPFFGWKPWYHHESRSKDCSWFNTWDEMNNLDHCQTWYITGYGLRAVLSFVESVKSFHRKCS